MVRRPSYDWISETQNDPHRVEVRTMYGKVIQSTNYPPGSDLRKLLIEALAKWNADGWTVDSFCDTTPTFFCSKGSERLCIGIYSNVTYKGHSGSPAKPAK